MIAAVSSEESWVETLALLLEHPDVVEIDSDILKYVRSPTILNHLLQTIPGHAITPDVFENLAQVPHYANELITLLLKHDREPLPTESVVTSLLRTGAHFKVLKALLDRNPTIRLTGAMVNSIQDANHAIFLLSREAEYVVSETALVRFAAAGDKFVRAALKHDRDIKIISRVLDACLGS
ncbi:uncharacterized protein BDV14DRAFT_198900 [Aspergillus stella-maris]|uniref:uncharacterized protein n=1 Tax=Aspergillus stella-maris TaxID=1810926 RepID=UPI003CCD01E9